MQTLSKKNLILSTFLSLYLLNGCSSHETISVSEAHLYNNHYGVVPDYQVDAQIEEELLAVNQPSEVVMPTFNDPSLTTDIGVSGDTFTAENYVQKAPVISYKYKDDPKFYSEKEMRNR